MKFQQLVLQLTLTQAFEQDILLKTNKSFVKSLAILKQYDTYLKDSTDNDDVVVYFTNVLFESLYEKKEFELIEKYLSSLKDHVQMLGLILTVLKPVSHEISSYNVYLKVVESFFSQLEIDFKDYSVSRYLTEKEIKDDITSSTSENAQPINDTESS